MFLTADPSTFNKEKLKDENFNWLGQGNEGARNPPLVKLFTFKNLQILFLMPTPIKVQRVTKLF